MFQNVSLYGSNDYNHCFSLINLNYVICCVSFSLYLLKCNLTIIQALFLQKKIVKKYIPPDFWLSNCTSCSFWLELSYREKFAVPIPGTNCARKCVNSSLLGLAFSFDLYFLHKFQYCVCRPGRENSKMIHHF